jgi:hypothetical protein
VLLAAAAVAVSRPAATSFGQATTAAPAVSDKDAPAAARSPELFKLSNDDLLKQADELYSHAYRDYLSHLRELGAIELLLERDRRRAGESEPAGGSAPGSVEGEHRAATGNPSESSEANARTRGAGFARKATAGTAAMVAPGPSGAGARPTDGSAPEPVKRLSAADEARAVVEQAKSRQGAAVQKQKLVQDIGKVRDVIRSAMAECSYLTADRGESVKEFNHKGENRVIKYRFWWYLRDYQMRNKTRDEVFTRIGEGLAGEHLAGTEISLA